MKVLLLKIKYHLRLVKKNISSNFPLEKLKFTFGNLDAF